MFVSFTYRPKRAVGFESVLFSARHQTTVANSGSSGYDTAKAL
jgi:hypothetical protein